MNATKEDHVSLQPLETHAGARQEALRHEAEQVRLARSLRPASNHHVTHATDVTHVTNGAEHAPHVATADSPLASLRLRVGHALVHVGTVLEGGTAEDTAPTR